MEVLNTGMEAYNTCSRNNVENLFHNFQYLLDMFLPYIMRSYEEPIRWFYIVAKPYDDKYEKNQKWYESYKAIRAMKRQFKPLHSLITREKNAAKVHLNMICTSDENLLKHHDKNAFKYRYHVQEIDGLYGRAAVLLYMLKEAKTRRMQEYKDYYEDCLYTKHSITDRVPNID